MMDSMFSSLFDVAVIGALVLSAAFVIAWLTRADFRAWIEQPKHAFAERIRLHDRERPRR